LPAKNPNIRDLLISFRPATVGTTTDIHQYQAVNMLTLFFSRLMKPRIIRNIIQDTQRPGEQKREYTYISSFNPG